MTSLETMKTHTLQKVTTGKVIYFAGSIRAGRGDVPIYAELISGLKSYGQVITEHVGDYGLSLHGQTHLSDRQIHDRDLRWLRASDVVVADVTIPSLGVGYEIATAIAWHIPVLALHRTEAGSLSAMIAGSSNIQTSRYRDVQEALNLIANGFRALGIETLS